MSVFDPTESKQPHRQPSFVGLPPISPGPEFGSALGISTADFGASYDGHRNSPSPPAKSSSPHPSSHLNGRGGYHHNNGPGPVSIMNEFHSASPPPQGLFMQGQYVVMQGQHPVTNQYPPGTQFNVNGMHHQSGSPPPGHDNSFMSRQAMKAPVGHQQVAFPPGSPPGMPSPSIMSNGQFAPPPGWKMESSQLQQPLTTQRHRPSPSISSLRQQNQSYEIDKETGLSTRSVSPPSQSPIDTRRPGQPALVQSAGQSSQQQNGFQPPNPPFAQQQHHQQQSPTLARTSTNHTQDSQYHDEHDGRRTSNMLSNIRSRLAGSGTDRRDSMGSRPQGTGVTEDGVSEASIPIEGQGRGAAKFFGFDDGAPRPSQDMRGSSPPPVGGAPFSPPREKRSIFTRPSGPGTGTQSAQETRRPSTAEGASGQAPIVGFGPGQPKKRFSKLTGMLNRDNKTETQLSQSQGQPTFMQGQRPSFQGQRAMPPGGPMGLPGQMGPPGDSLMSEFGRPRSATAGAVGGTRPSISDHSRSPSAQGFGSPAPMGAIREEERGRKPPGNFLAGIFGKRSESKTRDQRPSQSPPGLGQPTSMNPQGQVMILHRNGQSGSFLPIQGQTLTMQGQPLAPPQGQYAGLINQAQQQFVGQSVRQGMPNNQAFMQGPNPAQFAMYQQRQPSPGISPVTQSSGSPMATHSQGGVAGRQTPINQQGQQGYAPQRPQEQPPTMDVVQVATAVPIRQVSNSPNGNTGQNSAGPSPGGQSDSSRQRSASVVNQIEVGGNRKQNVDVQGTRSRAASQSVQQQGPVHIAALQTPTRKAVNSTSPRGSGQIVNPSQIDDASVSTGQQNGIDSPQESPQNRRVSQGLAPGGQQQSVSLQSTPRASPAPNPEQQSGPPGVPPKNTPAPNQSQGLGLSQPQSWQNPGNAGQSPSIAQQASVYRPSGPPIAAVVQSFSQQQPQSPWSIGRQYTNGQAGQQFPPGQSPQSMMMTPASQEQRPEKEGAFSKLLGKSKTFVYQMSEPQPSNDKAKPEKESKGVKGMLGAFKRDKPKPQPQPEVGKAPPGGPQWNIQSGQTPIGAQHQPQQQPGQLPQGQPMPQRLPQMQMPPKAQQVMGIGEGEQKIVSTPDEVLQPQPQTQSQIQTQLRSQNQNQGQPPQGPAPVQPLPPQPRPEQQRATSQPYQNYQNERQSSPKTSQPPTQQQQQKHRPQQSQAQAAQQPIGRSSIGGPAPSEGVSSPQQQQQQQHHQQQHQQLSQQAMGQNRSQLAAPTANMRAQNLKQQVAPHAPEPQYDPVPIPQGYIPVYGDGKPEMMRAPSYGQPYPGMIWQGHTQQWVYPGMLPGQVPQGPQGVPPHIVQQGWPQYTPYQGTPPPMMMAQHPPPQQYIQGQQVTPPPMMQGQAPPPEMSMQQPPMHGQVMASTNGQAHVVTPQHAVSPPHSAGFVPSQQGPPVSSDQMQAMQQNGQLIAPQAQQQFVIMPESAPAPVRTSNDGPTQSYTLESTKPESAQAPSQAVPRSAFAVVRPTAGHDQLQPPQDHADSLVPQRQLSGASEVSSLTSGPATSQGSTGAHSDHTVGQVQQPNGILGRSAASPEPTYERPPVTLMDEGQRMETHVTSTSTEKDDIYGATPRQSVHATPVQPQAQHNVERVIVPGSNTQERSGEPEVKYSGPLPNNRSPESKPTFKVEPPSQQGFIVDAPPVTGEPGTPSTIPAPDSASPSSTLSAAAPVVTAKSPTPSDEEPPSPTESELGKKHKEGETGEDGKALVNGKPVQSSAEIFEEHKRKQLLRDMEEKIAIFPTEPQQMLEPKKKKDDEAPMMSATSYPGQEWNPYGDGWVEDDL